MELIKRFLKPEKQSFFLLGPRGTGKSTIKPFRNARQQSIAEESLFDDEYPRKFGRGIDRHACSGKVLLVPCHAPHFLTKNPTDAINYTQTIRGGSDDARS